MAFDILVLAFSEMRDIPPEQLTRLNAHWKKFVHEHLVWLSSTFGFREVGWTVCRC